MALRIEAGASMFPDSDPPLAPSTFSGVGVTVRSSRSSNDGSRVAKVLGLIREPVLPQFPLGGQHRDL